MDGSKILAVLVALVLLSVAVRWQFDWTVERATNPDASHALPVSTPFTSPLCGSNNANCTDLTFDSGLYR